MIKELLALLKHLENDYSQHDYLGIKEFIDNAESKLNVAHQLGEHGMSYTIGEGAELPSILRPYCRKCGMKWNEEIVREMVKTGKSECKNDKHDDLCVHCESIDGNLRDYPHIYVAKTKRRSEDK